MPKYKHVYTAYGQLQAETIKLFLQSLGYNARISQESAGLTLGLTVGPLGKVKILVPEEEAATATEALDKMEDGDFIEDDETDG